MSRTQTYRLLILSTLLGVGLIAIERNEGNFFIALGAIMSLVFWLPPFRNKPDPLVSKGEVIIGGMLILLAFLSGFVFS